MSACSCCDSDHVHLFVSVVTFICVLLTSLISDSGLIFDRCPDCVLDCPVVYCIYNNSSLDVF